MWIGPWQLIVCVNYSLEGRVKNANAVVVHQDTVTNSLIDGGAVGREQTISIRKMWPEKHQKGRFGEYFANTFYSIACSSIAYSYAVEHSKVLPLSITYFDDVFFGHKNPFWYFDEQTISSIDEPLLNQLLSIVIMADIQIVTAVVRIPSSPSTKYVE